MPAKPAQSDSDTLMALPTYAEEELQCQRCKMRRCVFGILHDSVAWTLLHLQDGVKRSRDLRPIELAVPPCAAKEPPCRDESIVQASQISPSRVYEVMVNVPLFLNHFYTRNHCVAGKILRF